jgi:hypothetical protein
VVRLAFPAGHRCLVDPAALKLKGLKKIVGYEHRLYTRAGKYTGLFWPVNRPEFQNLTGLGLLDLDRLEKLAEKAKNTIRMDFPKQQAQIPALPKVPLRAGD